jgi:SPP1 family predicted phage head-tail adaptor
MNAGELDQRITIQVAETAKDSVGNILLTWRELKIVWAKVQTTGGNEQYRAAKQAAEATHKIKIRYLAGLKPQTMRILWQGKTLDIEFIDTSRQRRGELYISAKELVNNG